MLGKNQGGKKEYLPRPGQTIEIQALKSSCSPYRWWRAVVESYDHEHMSTLNRIGDTVEGAGQGWRYKHNHRTIYWFDRPYNLSEVYERDGRLKQLYVHIASPPKLEGDLLMYIDYELDVVWRPGRAPRVTDEDEFLAASSQFGRSPEFQAACRRAVEEALQLVMRWNVIGPAVFAERENDAG